MRRTLEGPGCHPCTIQALFEANKYVVASTFDPKYESSYWIRFVLGLIAGLLLSKFVSLKTGGG